MFQYSITIFSLKDYIAFFRYNFSFEYCYE